MIFPQKWQSRLENENFEISRNSAYSYVESANKKGAKFVIISSGSPKKLKIENFFLVENSKVEKNLKKIIKFREKCSKKKNCSKGMKIRKGLFYWIKIKAIWLVDRPQIGW